MICHYIFLSRYIYLCRYIFCFAYFLLFHKLQICNFYMGTWGQVQGEVQGKEAALRNLEEVVQGTEGATWSEGACTRGGARRAEGELYL